jgi:hypothetical protein
LGKLLRPHLFQETDMVDRELLKNILEKIQMTGDLPTGDEGVMVIEAAKAYLEIPDPEPGQAAERPRRDARHPDAQRPAERRQQGRRDPGKKMFNTVTAATAVIQAAMVRAQS